MTRFWSTLTKLSSGLTRLWSTLAKVFVEFDQILVDADETFVGFDPILVDTDETTVFPGRNAYFRASLTILSTSPNNFFASYTIPSLTTYFTPPTRSGLPVSSFTRMAPVP